MKKIFKEFLSTEIKSYDYYVQIRRRQFGFYYNIPEGQRHAPCDSNLNAFVIELFGLMSPHDPRRVFRFLMTAFAAYPDKDYCLLSLNVVNRITPALYEILKYFVVSPTEKGFKICNFVNIYIFSV